MLVDGGEIRTQASAFVSPPPSDESLGRTQFDFNISGLIFRISLTFHPHSRACFNLVTPSFAKL